MDKKNSIAVLLRFIGWTVIAIGIIRFLAGLTIDQNEILGEVAVQLGWNSLLSSIIGAVLLFGFAEVIFLLEGIYKHLVLESTESTPVVNSKATEKEFTFKPMEELQESIHSFYKKRGESVTGFRESPYDGIAIVEVESRVDIVDVEGFVPKILTEEEMSQYPKLKEYFG